jgi:hypothetical protein
VRRYRCVQACRRLLIFPRRPSNILWGRTTSFHCTTTNAPRAGSGPKCDDEHHVTEATWFRRGHRTQKVGHWLRQERKRQYASRNRYGHCPVIQLAFRGVARGRRGQGRADGAVMALPYQAGWPRLCAAGLEVQCIRTADR